MIYDIIKTVQFEYCFGDVTVTHEGTSWRVMPSWVIVHTTGMPGTIELADSAHEYGSGYAVIVPPNIKHKFSIPVGATNISRWCHANFRLSNGLEMCHFIDVPLIWPPRMGAKKIGMLNERMSEIFHADYRHDINLTLELLECGMSLLREITARGKLKIGDSVFSRESQRIMPVLEFINNNLAQPLSRSQLSEIAEISPSRFHTVFSNFIGTGPMEFVRKARMAKACQLLRETIKSVNIIAAEVGYDDQYIFSRAFKNHIGISPLSFRKNPTIQF